MLKKQKKQPSAPDEERVEEADWWSDAIKIFKAVW